MTPTTVMTINEGPPLSVTEGISPAQLQSAHSETVSRFVILSAISEPHADLVTQAGFLAPALLASSPAPLHRASSPAPTPFDRPPAGYPILS